jgi:hypothetical protein
LQLLTAVRLLLATCLVAGCTFDHGFEEQVAVDDPMGTDAGVGSGSSSTCKFGDSALRLCVEFDNGANGADESGYHMDADAHNLTATTRASDPAAAVYWDSNLDVAENPMLDISGAITFEAWIYVTNYPPFGYYGIVHNVDQYSMTIDSSGKFACWIGMQKTDVSLTRNTWHHVACTYDSAGSEYRLRAFVDGALSKCGDASGLIPTMPTRGTRLVDNLTGMIDDVRIYARALPSTEICTHANKSGCTSSCD